jgi:hypothetical protein
VQLFLNALSVATGVMQLGTVVFLAFGLVRKYAFVLAYCSVQLITSLLEVFVVHKFGTGGKQYKNIFWTDEIVLDLLLFLILILLTYRAMEGSPARAAMGRMLGAVTLAVLVLPFVLFKGAFVRTGWFDHTSQMLNFGAALLNLGLWTALLGSHKRDRTLLTVSAGFGILATGAAISFGLRRLIHTPGIAYATAGDIFVFANLACSTILCWAFRPSNKKAAAPPATPPATPRDVSPRLPLDVSLSTGRFKP